MNLRQTHFPRIAGVMLLLLTSALFAQQPTTVGDLLDKGGTKLTKDELSALVPGAVTSGIQEGAGAKYNNTLAIDGSINGSAVRTSGQLVTITGRWNINDRGQLCQELSTGPGSKFGGCSFGFSLDNVYYFSSSDERAATLAMREIKKK